MHGSAQKQVRALEWDTLRRIVERLKGVSTEQRLSDLRGRALLRRRAVIPS